MAWAAISEDERDRLNVALNEATWAAISVDTTARGVRLLLDVLSLPADDVTAADSRVVVTVNQVSRVAAWLRMGWWNNDAAEVVPLEAAELDATVRSFSGCPIYGWQVIDPRRNTPIATRPRSCSTISTNKSTTGAELGVLPDLYLHDPAKSTRAANHS
jgi:hypothetical protein